jgi:hypothetical protein
MLFAGLLLLFRYVGTGRGAPAPAELQRYIQAQESLRVLLSRLDGLFDESEQGELQNSLQQLSAAITHWSLATDPKSDLFYQAQRSCAMTMVRIRTSLDGVKWIERLWVKPGGQAAAARVRQRWPNAGGVLLLRVGREDLPGDAIPLFVHAEYDLSKVSEASLELPPAPLTYVVATFSNAAGESTHFPLSLVRGEVKLAAVDLDVQVPPTGTLKVTIVDAATGLATAAVAGVYAPDNQLMVPADALRFDDGGAYYTSGQARPNVQAHYWPGSSKQHKVFFTAGQFSLTLRQGNYVLIAGKGMEYLPVRKSVAVRAGATESQWVVLNRWIDMPARGWYSGDGHVHYERRDREADRRLLLWASAEDVHLVNVLRMGDAREIYYPQYSFGQAGRVLAGNYAIVPGQEDPRTNVMGHSLELNLQAPVRFADQYYLYDLVFDEVRRQGGLVGYPHIYRPPIGGYWVARDMTLNIAHQRADFAEFCEYGDIGEELYYEFLNLGFPLAASAGSDVPYGNTIGTSRVYAYTGNRFSPDAWFAALREGHTFVTNGPMLEFTVNGQIPGTEIHAKAGDRLRIKAAAYGNSVLPGHLEVVEQGEVIHSAQPLSQQARELSVEFTIAAQHSTWIAARCYGAHTTPVYVKVGEERFWKRSQIGALIARRLEQLQEVRQLIREGIPDGHAGGWDNPATFHKVAAQLEKRVKEARAIYEGLLMQSKHTSSPQ